MISTLTSRAPTGIDGRSRRGPGRRWVALLLAVVVIAAACGDSDDTDSGLAPGPDRIDRDTADAGGAAGDGDDGRVVTRSASETTAAPPLVSEQTDETDAAADEEFDAAGTARAESEAESASGPTPIIGPDVRPDDRRGEEPDRSRFVDVNPFVDPARDPLSTFAMDVDTGSYTLMRRSITEGWVPDPATVRVEEFVNFFDQDYAPPTDQTFAVYADGAPNPFGTGDTSIVRVGIQAREVAERLRPDASLTFVIDVSGSMGSDRKLELVQDSLWRLVSELRPTDSVAIVAYDDRAWTVLEPTPVEFAREITRAVDTLRPGGSTNAEAGLRLAYDEARRHFDPERINRVILASDGVANVGDTSADGIWERIARDAGDGIHLVAVGVGFGEYDDALLERLADQGNGFYAYIDTLDEADRLFRDDLLGTLQTVAMDAKVQVEFDERVVAAYRLLGFENRDLADRDFRDDRVDAGEIGSGHSVTALYEIEWVGRTVDGDIGEVRIRWTDPATGRSDELRGVVSPFVLRPSFDEAEPRFRADVVAATFAELLRGSPYVDPSISFRELASEANFANRELNDPQVVEMADLIAEAGFLLG